MGTLRSVVALQTVQPMLESENFTLAQSSILVVTNTNDSGPGSLRQTIADATSGDTIKFDLSLAGKTIMLASTLIIDKDITVDGDNLDQRVKVSGDTNSNNYGDVRIFQVTNSNNVELKGIDIVYGYVGSGTGDAGHGGGILNYGNLTLTNCRMDGNRALRGGGIYNSIDAILIISNCVLSNNIAEDSGGGISNSGTLNITNSTFVNNTANPWGSAIYAVGMQTITNSTFYNNNISGGGGTIYHSSSGSTLSLVSENNTFNANVEYAIYNADGNAIINNNTIFGNIGGIYIFSDQVDISNTIVSNNFFNGDPQDCYKSNVATIGSDNHNLFSSDKNCGVSVYGYGVSLYNLADNGGPTQTMALKPDSPAIDAGDDATCEITDQRGASRPQGAHCDIGAYEEYPDTTFMVKDIRPTPNIGSEPNWLTNVNGILYFT